MWILGAFAESRSAPINFAIFLRPPARIHLRRFHWRRCRIFVKSDTGDMKIRRENKTQVKIGHFTWRPKYVLLLPATLNRNFKALSSSELVSGSYDSEGGLNVTRTSHMLRCTYTISCVLVTSRKVWHYILQKQNPSLQPQLLTITSTRASDI